MIDLFQLSAEIQVKITDIGLPFCFIGGVALQAWGDVRVTQDVDVSVFTGFESEESTIKHLMSFFEPRIPDARQFALDGSVEKLPLRSEIF